MRREVCRLDSPDRVLGQMTKFLTLQVADRRAQILDFHQPLTDEYHLSHFSDACDPGIANQLRIECQQPLRFFRISAGGCLPFQQAACPIKFPDPINVGDEFVSIYRSCELDLQVTPRLVNPDAVVLAEAGEEHDPLLEHAIPGVVVRKVQILIFASRPFTKEDVPGIFTAKVGAQSLFEGTPEKHRGTSVFLFPAIEIAMAIAPRAGQVLTDLGVAVVSSGHLRTIEIGGRKFLPAASGSKTVQPEQGSAVEDDMTDLHHAGQTDQLRFIDFIAAQ